MATMKRHSSTVVESDQFSLAFLLNNGRKFDNLSKTVDDVKGVYGHVIEFTDTKYKGLLILIPGLAYSDLKETY